MPHTPDNETAPAPAGFSKQVIGGVTDSGTAGGDYVNNKKAISNATMH